MIASVNNKRDVVTYCQSVLSGKVVACDAIIKAVERYMSDQERAGEDDFPYYFDEETAEFYCDCFPLLLCHSKGRHAGKPFCLSPWQKFIVWQFFGWKRASDGFRRFRRLFKTVARKNGKSTFAAGLELILTFVDGEPGSEVYIGATKLDQAKIIHEEAERMLRKSPGLLRKATILKNNISFKQTNSFARPLGSDRPFDGLNPHGVFFDEMHAWKEHHRGFYDTLTTGSAARSQPVQVTISTKGDDKSLIFNEDLEYSRKVVTGEVVDEALLVFIFELDEEDDLFDPSNWIKANPNLGVSVAIDYLESQSNEARNKTTGKKRFERYHGNRTVTSIDSPIKAEQWDASCVSELSDYQDADFIGAGVDLGGRDDLAAYAFSLRFVHSTKRPALVDGQCPKCRAELDGVECDSCEVIVWRYESWSKAFIAEDTERDLSEEPFATWIDEGKLIVAKYVLTELRESLIANAQRLGCQYFCYDPYQAANLAEELEREGLKPVKMAQNCAQFNEPLEEFLSALGENRFKALVSDEVLRWSAMNMAVRTSSQGSMPDKPKSKEKIDPMVAMLMSQRASTFGRRRVDPASLYVS